MDVDLVSIIVPAYNAENNLEICINSLLNQTYKNIEIIIINDGSKDKTELICKKLSGLDGRVKFYSIENGGVSHARNFGIKNSNGKFICFVDSDDIVSNDYCEILINGLNKGFDLSVAGLETVYSQEVKINNRSFKFNSASISEAYKFLTEKTNFFGFPFNKMYKKEILDDIELFDESIYMCEDTLFNSSYLEKCKKIVYTDDVVYYYYQNPNSVTNNYFFNDKKYSVIKSMEKMELIYKKMCMENIVYLYMFYLLNINILEVCIKNSKIKKSVKNNKTKYMLKYILKSDIVSIKRKFRILFRYLFPILTFKLRKKEK